LEGLYDPVNEKVGKCSLDKEIWDKLHNIYSSPITNSQNFKEDAGTEQEERCSSCQTDSKEEEYKINRRMFFFFNSEKGGHLEFECPYLKIESDGTKNTNEIEYNLETKKENNHEVECSQ
jgi:hypothetical protein